MAGVHSRVPIIALSYDERDKAVEKELLVDYDNGKIYVVSAHDKTVIYDLTYKIAEYLKETGLTGDDITVNIEGIGEVNLSEFLSILSKDSIELVDLETGNKFVGSNYQYDLDSITIKDRKIQVTNFDTAPNDTVPVKSNGVVRWLPYGGGSGGGGSIPSTSSDIITVNPSSVNDINLTADSCQLTTINSADTFNVLLPTIDSTNPTHTEFRWNLTIGDTVPTINFPANVSWEFNVDAVLNANTINVFIFSSWNNGALWLVRNISYGNPIQPVTTSELEENYYDKNDIDNIVSWKVEN